MSFLSYAMVHVAAMPPLRPIAHHLTNHPPLDHPAHTHALAGGFDNPAPTPPPGLQPIAKKWLGWLKWISGIAGIFGLCVSGIMMAIGRRNRSYLAGEGAAGIPWVFGGLLVVSLATQIVQSVLT
ncbi:MAG: hypothetical protein ACRDP6_32495 [Actinoallomurus sp.]